MESSAPPFLVSADPGSSDKGWAVASCDAEAEAEVKFEVWKTPDLPKLIDQLCERAHDSPILLALDAPLRAFGGLQAPENLDPLPGRFDGKKDRLSWPFDVNPFSQRPCERALGSVPPLNLRGEAQRALARAVDALIGNDSDDQGKERKSFVKTHQGISVLGYMGAPHAPVVRTFLNALEKRAKGSVEISYDAETEGESWRKPGRITVLESHPAVAMGFYSRYRRGRKGVPVSIKKYKGGKSLAGCFDQLCGFAGSLLGSSCSLPSDSNIASDDHLDALIGLLLLVELAEGRGDLFGTPEDGYFLVPIGRQKVSFRELWRAADAESRSRLAS